MIQTGKYVHGTAAEKLEYDVYSENKVLKAKKLQRSNNKAKFKLICAILMMFSVCFFVMYRYAVITELNYKIYQMNKQYNEVRNENSSLRVQIEKECDLNSIREIAVKKLGMQMPDKYQIAYVKVPKHNYTKVAQDYRAGDAKVPDNMIAVLMDKVSRIARFVY
ncbi:MAG: cell division protein FtsL [Clostridia bacterium]|nr:cell division protein FtsL [Clostridia bacterium]